MKKIAIAAVTVALALGVASTPASAGRTATLEVTPAVVEQGGSTVITNTDNGASTCQPFDDQPASVPSASETSIVELVITDPDDEDIIEVDVVPDDLGNWSYQANNLTTLGVYTVVAICDPTESSAPSAFPSFGYATATFEVIAGQVTPTSSTPTTVTPTTTATTTTTAGSAAVTATPKYTG